MGELGNGGNGERENANDRGFSRSPVLRFSRSPVLPFSHSPILPFSHSPIPPFPHSPIPPFPSHHHFFPRSSLDHPSTRDREQREGQRYRHEYAFRAPTQFMR